MAQFVSFVGTQIMGTLNPILGIMNTKKPPKDFLLLYTGKTEKQAKKICEWLSQKFNSITVQNKGIPGSFNIDDISLNKNEEIFLIFLEV